MKIFEHYKPKKSEFLVLALGLLMLLIPLVLSAFNIQISAKLFKINESANQSRIGEFNQVSNNVKRKGGDESTFSAGKAGEPIFMGDSVTTGDNSTAKLTFNDGSLIELGPHALVKVFFANSFSLGGVKRVTEVQVESGEVKVSSESAGIRVKEKSGKVIHEAPHSPNSPEGSGNAPAPRISFFNPESAFLSNASTTPEKKVALTPPPIVAATSTPTPTPSPTPSSTPSSTPTPVSIESMRVKYEGAPFGGVLNGNKAFAAQKLSLEWSTIGHVRGEYAVTVTVQDQKKTFTTRAKKLDWNIPSLAPGKMEWKVETFDENQVSIQSKAQSVKWDLPAPELALPAAGAQVNEIFNKGPQPKVLTTWKKMALCPQFEIRMSAEKNLDHAAWSRKTPDNFFTVPSPHRGHFFWRVDCIYRADVVRPSAAREMTIIPPLTAPPKDGQ